MYTAIYVCIYLVLVMCMYVATFYTLLATQSSINVWSLLNGCKLQTILVTVSDQHQQSPVMCYTNNFSGDGHYTSALIASIGTMLKAFTIRKFYPEKYLTIMKSW